MTFTVETGLVVANANSYVTEAYSDTYHDERGNTAWDGVSDKTQLLIKATDYMVEFYRHRWKGYRKSAVQTLDWPRANVYLEPFIVGAVSETPYLVANNIVPEEVKRACCELALRLATTSSLAADMARGKKSVTVGPITTVYDDADPQFTRYRAVDALLKPYLRSASSNVRVMQT